MRSASLRLPAVFASLGPMLCSRSRLRDIACRFESTCTGEGGAVRGGEGRQEVGAGGRRWVGGQGVRRLRALLSEEPNPSPNPSPSPSPSPS